MLERKLILIGGGSGAGKSTYAATFENAAVLSTDSFYRGKSRMGYQTSEFNGDDPSSVNLDELRCKVYALLHGSGVYIPKWNPQAQEREGDRVERLNPMPLIIVEGIFAFCNIQLREMADELIFIDVPRDERIRRRLERDVLKGRTPQQTLVYSTHVEAMHDKYIEPQKKWATTVITQRV